MLAEQSRAVEEAKKVVGPLLHRWLESGRVSLDLVKLELRLLQTRCQL